MSILAHVTEQDVVTQPFPHILVQDVIDIGHCRELLLHFPPLATIAEGSVVSSNERYSYPTRKVQQNREIADCWKNFLIEHVSQPFLMELIRVFGSHIRATYPFFEKRFAPFNKLRAGIRGVNSFAESDVLMDAQICLNTPVTTRPSSVRGPHVDLPNKLFAGLLYLRDDGDDSRGGELELYVPRLGFQPLFNGQKTRRDDLEVAQTVTYKRNVLILFLNSVQALHGVTIRSVTSHPRRFVNLVAEVREPLFILPQVGSLEKMGHSKSNL